MVAKSQVFVSQLSWCILCHQPWVLRAVDQVTDSSAGEDLHTLEFQFARVHWIVSLDLCIIVTGWMILTLNSDPDIACSLSWFLMTKLKSNLSSHFSNQQSAKGKIQVEFCVEQIDCGLRRAYLVKAYTETHSSWKINLTVKLLWVFESHCLYFCW